MLPATKRQLTSIRNSNQHQAGGNGSDGDQLCSIELLLEKNDSKNYADDDGHLTRSDDVTDGTDGVGEQNQQVRNDRARAHQHKEAPPVFGHHQQLSGALVPDVKPQGQRRSDLHQPHEHNRVKQVGAELVGEGIRGN